MHAIKSSRNHSSSSFPITRQARRFPRRPPRPVDPPAAAISQYPHFSQDIASTHLETICRRVQVLLDLRQRILLGLIDALDRYALLHKKFDMTQFCREPAAVVSHTVPLRV
jgi:hypothetical protein